MNNKPRLLITGGTGTIGRAFIRRYQEAYTIFALGHSELRVGAFHNDFPKVPVRICHVEDFCSVRECFEWARPDFVVHAAAIKHIDLAETQPRMVCRVNVNGSLNVLSACSTAGIRAVAISTDKAADPRSAYGHTKCLMEKCFLEAGMSVCRFGNVAWSAGSVLPLWREQIAKGLPLQITDPKMQRFMFTQVEAADLIQAAIDLAGTIPGILTQPFKAVSIGRLLSIFAPQHPQQTIGARPGEQYGEVLLNRKESGQAVPVFRVSRHYTFINPSIPESARPGIPYTTENAPQMTDEEIMALIQSE